MLSTQILTTLVVSLALSALPTPVDARIRDPLARAHGSFSKKHSAVDPLAALEKVRRDATRAMEIREGYAMGSKRADHTKRKVRKRKSGTCGVSSNATATSIESAITAAATATATGSTSLNGTDSWANATAVANGTAAWPNATAVATASATDGWGNGTATEVDSWATASASTTGYSSINAGEQIATNGGSSSATAAASSSGKHHHSHTWGWGWGASSSATATASASDAWNTASASASDAWNTASASATASASDAWNTASASASSSNSWGASSSASDAWNTASATASASANISGTATGTASSSAASATSTYSSSWSLVESWSGSSFFDNWDFWAYSDPTHGTVEYVDASTAWSEGLVSINSNNRAIMKVDTTQTVSSARKSVRLHGHLTYTGGLVVMDSYHMPTGCGTWPAWWSNGPNWPAGGEIDILEGVNGFTQNQVSLHTNPGCTLSGDLTQTGTLLTSSSYDAYNCGSVATSNQGCGVRDETSGNSYGTGFNNVQGGVYAMKWDLTGIKVWWFPRSSIPDDLTAETPVPDNWGTPVADYPSTSCSPYEFFYDHFAIFDTTLCGDWAGADSVWNSAYAGQSESCASSTGYSTCSDYVLNSGSSFSEAYWEIASVKFYNSTTEV